MTIATLYLPPDQRSAPAIEQFERSYVASPRPAHTCTGAWRASARRVVQMHGDSATFDWSAHVGWAGLVFVDGLHAYDYAKKDSETAMRLIQPGGIVLWHDYGDQAGRDPSARGTRSLPPARSGQYPRYEPGGLARTRTHK